MKVTVSTEAAEELMEAAAWYEMELPGLGERLIDTFEQATVKLREPNPPLTPVIGESAKLHAQRLIVPRFPFSIVVVVNSGTITIVAFAHHSRRPGYWKQRLTEGRR